MIQLLIEALVVGFIVVFIGTFVSKFTSKYFKVELPKECKDWNKKYIMEISLFTTGFLTHLICEFTNINKWYCNNSYACLKK